MSKQTEAKRLIEVEKLAKKIKGMIDFYDTDQHDEATDTIATYILRYYERKQHGKKTDRG